MIFKISIVIAIFMISFNALAEREFEHDYVGFGWQGYKATNSTGGLTFTETGFGIGINAEKSLTDTFYIGGILNGSNITVDISDTTDYMDGKISSTSVYLGSERKLSDSMFLGFIASYLSASSDITIRQTFSNDIQVSSSATGMAAGANIVMPLSSGRIVLGVTKGVTGDYSNGDAIFYGIFRMQSTPKMFAQLGYAYSNNANSFSGVLGYYIK